MTEASNAKAYEDRRHNIWFVKINNFKLFTLFKKLKEDPKQILELVEKQGKRAQLLFVEGFFDAEGCVKIIKEPVRKTPKICPMLLTRILSFSKR